MICIAYKAYDMGTEMGITRTSIECICVCHEYWIKWSPCASNDYDVSKWISSDTLYELQFTAWNVPIEGTIEIMHGTVIVPN